MIDKLQGHFGFTRIPFGRDLAPGMLHRHAAHNEAVARISWCITERSIGVVTGEVGAGKTVSVRTVLAGLDTARHTVIYLPNPLIGVRGILEAMVAAFGAKPTNLSSRLVTQAAAALTAERDERGRTPVLVLDEAHLLAYEQLETIRMLTNHAMDADSPLACLLVGQPTLRRTMKLAVLAALEQRTALRYTMPPMTAAETTSYVKHHIGLAGRADPLFSDDAVALIHNTARGYPRAVNNLAMQALVATFATGSPSSTKQPPEQPSPRYSATDHRHHADNQRHRTHESPARHPPAGLSHTANIGIASDAPVGILSAGNTCSAAQGLHLARHGLDRFADG